MSVFKRLSSKSDLKEEFSCTIRFLDDSEPMTITCKRDTIGQWVLDQVCAKLNLVEKDYFGLRFADAEKQRHWLDPLKTVYRQLKSVNPLVLCFRVKFYPDDPLKLHEEITRYFLFLQLRRDLQHGRLQCTPTDANVLASYIIQAELGDYESEDHLPGYVSEFKMLPKQNIKMEEKIADLHKAIIGEVPSVSESNFLKKANELDTYGVDPHQVKDQKGNQLYLGITYQGILSFQGNRKTHQFRWNQIRRIAYEGKMFIVHVAVSEEEEAAEKSKKRRQAANRMGGLLCTGSKRLPSKVKRPPRQKQHAIGFKCPTLAACKYLWKCAVEQQFFFTLSTSTNPPRVRSGSRIFARGSKFRFSGRCQNEAYAASNGIQRDEPNFSRSLSHPNFARPAGSRDSTLKNTSLPAEVISEEVPVDVPKESLKVEVSSPAKRPSSFDTTNKVPQRPVSEEAVSEQTIKVVEHVPVATIQANTSLDITASSIGSYNPESTQFDDDDDEEEDENIKRKSLDYQIQELDAEIVVSKSSEANHICSTPIPKEKRNDVTVVEEKKKEETAKPGVIAQCSKMLVYTFFFVSFTLAITLMVSWYFDIRDPYVDLIWEQVDKVRATGKYLTDKVYGLFSS